MKNLPDISRVASSPFRGKNPQKKPKKTDKAPRTTFLESVCVFFPWGGGQVNELPDPKTSFPALGSFVKTGGGKKGGKFWDPEHGWGTWKTPTIYMRNVRQMQTLDRFGSHRWVLKDMRQKKKYIRKILQTLQYVSSVKQNIAWNIQKTILLRLTKLCTRRSNIFFFNRERENQRELAFLCLKIKRFAYHLTQNVNRRQYGFIGKLILPKEKNLEDVPEEKKIFLLSIHKILNSEAQCSSFIHTDIIV